MRPIPVLVLALLLAGCAGSAFEKEAEGPESFARDDTACAAAALLSLPPRASGYDRAGAFNRLYGGCMAARGHGPGPYARALPDTPAPAPGES
jgi:hypothetical protein